MHVPSVVVAVLALSLPLSPVAADDDLVGWVTGDVTRAYAGGAFVGDRYTLPGPAPARGDPTRESMLGNALGQALRDVRGDPSWSGPRLGVATPEALGADLLFDVPDPEWPPPSGSPDRSRVTRDELEAVLPSPEPLWWTTVTGTQLRELVEEQWRSDAHDGRPDVHLGLSRNVRYVDDPTRARGDRVLSLHVDDVAVDPAARYRLTVPASLLVGDGAFAALADGTETVPVGLTDRDALAAALGLVVDPDLAERAVGVSGLPERVVPGTDLTFRLSGFDLLSVGAYRNDTIGVRLAGVELAEFLPLPPDADPEGAQVTVAVPEDVPPGPGVLELRGVWGSRVEVPVTVGPAQEPTTVTVAGAGGTQVYGAATTTGLRVQVGPPGVEGAVDVLEGERVVASYPLVDGRAQHRLAPTTPGGTYDLTVRYRGDERHAPSQAGPARLTVLLTPTTATLVVRRPVAWLPAAWAVEVRAATGVPVAGRVELRAGGRVLAASRVVAGRAGGVVPQGTDGPVVAVLVPDRPGDVQGGRSVAAVVPR